MASPIVNWKRFWCPRDGSYHPVEDDYLPDFDSPSFRGDPGITSLDKLLDIPCLILLGEPGIGKSNEIIKHTKFIQEKVRETGDQLLNLDLKNYSSEARLFDAIFQNPKLQKWRKEKKRLYLLLDSLDEALLDIKPLASALPNEIEQQQLPIERLYIRIVSRVADWPAYLEEQFIGMWGEENISAYKLLQLRKKDVIEFANANAVNGGGFITAIDEREAAPLAARPVTLKFLISTYLRDGDIPKSKTELYKKGCLYLCEEEESRKISGRAGRLLPKQKMMIAGRIAALSVLTNKAFVWAGAFDDDAKADVLVKSKLAGGQEFVNNDSYEIKLDEINETLRHTGLFISAGPERLGWAHRTYAEFLAAWYICEHHLETSKILSLIIHPGDMKQRLIPQLQEMVAWLATFSTDVFGFLKDRNPEVLLRSDVITADESLRSALTHSLLTLYDSEKFFEFAWKDFEYYKKLNHPGLAEQLCSFMCDKAKNFRTRRLAIDIAEECRCTALLEQLAEIALDIDDLYEIREQAAHAIIKMGDEKTKLKLKALISDTRNDPRDQLKAYGFYAIWPNHLSASELFQLISPRKQTDFIGKYWDFLEYSIVQYLKVEDIPIALDWVVKVSVRRLMPGDTWVDLVDKVMFLGWNNLEKPGISTPFALAAMVRIANHDGIFSRYSVSNLFGKEKPLETIETDDEKRHMLVLEILALSSLPEISFDLDAMVFWPTTLIFPKDFEWLLTVYGRTKSASQKSAIAQWLRRICDSNNQEQLDILYGLYKTDPIFTDVFGGWFGVIELTSEQATQLKKWYHISLEGEEHESEKFSPPLLERIKTLLENSETGDTSAWWKLNFELARKLDDPRFVNDYEHDITELPSWKILDATTMGRIMLSAKRYIVDGQPNNQEWLEKNNIWRPARAGYRALRLVCKEDPEYLIKMDAQTWQKWAAIVLAYPVWSAEKFNVFDDTLLKIAHIYAPEEIRKTLLISIKKENRKDGVLELQRLNCIWDEILEILLVRVAGFKNLKLNLFRSILWFLLEHQSKLAQEFVIGKVKLYETIIDDCEIEKISASIQAFLIHSNHPQWNIVWPVLKNHFELANDVFAALAWQQGSENLFSKLSFEELAELYLFMVENYPFEEDPNHEDENAFHEITPREDIGRWRDAIPMFMANSGEVDACVSLRALSEKLPNIDHIKYLVFRAEFNMRQKTWRPLIEAELLDLFLKPETILIENERHLLDSIIQSLRNLDELFHGETPQAIYLWSEWKQKDGKKQKIIYRPSDENRLSDYVKLHLERELKQQGIVVGREVEIRRGQKTDIYVDAIRKIGNNIYDNVRVIIETKGCWHPELETAMKTQLRDRYLKNNQCRVGLYLVGWFNCEKWDSDDGRSKDAPNYRIDYAKNHFEEQAHDLSNGEVLLKSYILDLTI